MRTIDASDGIRITQTSTASLLAKVLWITTFGFVLTAVGAWIAPESLGIGYGAILLLNFALIFGISYAARRSAALGLTLFYVFTTLMGVQISPILSAYLHTAGGATIVLDAAVTTAMGMAVMALVAQMVSFDYRRVANYAIGALFGLIIVGIISMFWAFVPQSVYAWASLAIFSVLLLVDFMRLKDADRSGLGSSTGTATFLALSIYLDAINIFIALLQIFGGGRRDSR